MPGDISKYINLYKPNYIRVVHTLKFLGAQKNGKNADSDIDEWLKALNDYNKRIKFIKETLDQQSSAKTGTGIVSYRYSSCKDLIERLQVPCGSKEAGNNSPEVRNEIVSILYILLNSGAIKPI